MFRVLFTLAFAALLISAKAQKHNATSGVDKSKEQFIVEASCGQCKFALPGKSCDLAVKINGKAYFVDGTKIDSHGDAHADDGFCNSVRKAAVQGEVVNERFKATYFKLLPVEDGKVKSDKLKKD